MSVVFVCTCMYACVCMCVYALLVYVTYVHVHVHMCMRMSVLCVCVCVWYVCVCVLCHLLDVVDDGVGVGVECTYGNDRECTCDGATREEGERTTEELEGAYMCT